MPQPGVYGRDLPMKVLGRQLVPPFDSFWERHKAEIPVPVEYIEEGLSSVFGEQGADFSTPGLPAWASLPDDDLAYHVAHELTHIVLRQRGFPKTGYGIQYPRGSAEARIGGDIEEMVLHPALEKLLQPFGFKNDFIRGRMLNGALNGLSSSPVPEKGTPWSYTWAIRYCELQLELEPSQWLRLRAIYVERAPDVRALGEELAAIMRAVGWGEREQALEAMIRVRDALGLKVDDRVLVIDPLSNQVY